MRSNDHSKDSVTYEEGSMMARRHGIVYRETSSLTGEGLDNCFTESVSI